MRLLILSLFMTLAACNNSKTLEVGYSGKDLSKDASIERNKQTKEAYLDIKVNTDWQLYIGSTVESVNMNIPVAKGESAGRYKLNVDSLSRYYFLLVTDEGQAILSDNHLPMAGGYNFRDMGGLLNREGRYVKWGRVLRSDDLHNLTDGDLKYLSSIPLKTIVDFRAKQEIKEAPDKVPMSVINTPVLELAPGNLLSSDMRSKENTAESLANLMIVLNQLLVSDSECVSQYKAFFALLQDETKSPLMFHCSAGKDRTGMGAALFLSSLGVSEDVILDNYLESNIYLGDKYASWLAENPELKSMTTVKPEYLRAGFDLINEKYGSVDQYLKDVLNVDINKMKSLYLY